jgi:aminoglycoside phosphotransferase (APT) family kinase protein
LIADDPSLNTLVLSHLRGEPLARQRHPQALANMAHLARVFADVRSLERWSNTQHWDPAWRVEYAPRLERLRLHGLLDDEGFATLDALWRTAQNSAYVLAHGDLELRNVLADGDTLGYVGWGDAGVYLQGFDLALLWVVLGGVLGPRRVIEELILEEHGDGAGRAAFWVNVVLLLARELRTLTARPPALERDDLRRRLENDWRSLRARGWVGA